MITRKKVDDDIFKSNAQTLTNPVNCFGVMGRGLAMDFKLKYPEMFIEYKHKCRKGQVRLGEPYLWKGPEKWVLNFPTKHYYGDQSSEQYIEKGLEYLLSHYKEWGITSIAVPALGCGLGGLSWDVVKFRMHYHLSRLEVPVEIYEPR